MKKKKIHSVLVDCQRGIGVTLRVKPLTWGHGPNFGSPGICVVTSVLFIRTNLPPLERDFLQEVNLLLNLPTASHTAQEDTPKGRQR